MKLATLVSMCLCLWPATPVLICASGHHKRMVTSICHKMMVTRQRHIHMMPYVSCKEQYCFEKLCHWCSIWFYRTNCELLSEIAYRGLCPNLHHCGLWPQIDSWATKFLLAAWGDCAWGHPTLSWLRQRPQWGLTVIEVE